MNKIFLIILSILLNMSILNAQKTINGVVRGMKGELIFGVNISVKEKPEIKTMTNLDGEYLLTVPDSTAKLIFSYVGMKTKEVEIKGKTVVNVILYFEAMELEEVEITERFGAKPETESLSYAETDSSPASVSSERKVARSYDSRRTMSAGSYMLSRRERSDKRSYKKRSATKKKSKPRKIVTDTKVKKTDENPRIKSGLLTAGEINDFSKWELWKDISAKQLKEYKEKWQINPNKRFCIQLSSKNGNPIINSSVKLTDKNQNVVWTAKTDNTGKAELWANLFDTISDKNKFSIEIESSGKKYFLNNPKEIKKGINKKIIDTECNIPDIVDIAFVVDATGSMGDEIEYLKVELEDVIKKVQKKHPEIQINLGSVFYRDTRDKYLTRKSDLSDNIDFTLDFIKEQDADGGGDFPEAVDEGINVAVNELSWSENTRAKIMFLILDAPPHDLERVREKIKSVTIKAAEKGIRIVPVTCSGINKSTEYLMRSLSLATNGTYVFLTDDSGIGGGHIKPTTDKFKVESLNDILIRIISQYSVAPSCEFVEKFDETSENDYSSVDENNVYQSDFFTDTDEIIEDNSKITLYPNPADEIINITSSKQITDFYLFDLSGKLLDKIKRKSRKSTINISEYPTGIYFIRYSYKKEMKSQKLVILH